MFNTRCIEMYMKDKNTVTCVIRYNDRLMLALNNFVKTYPIGTKFTSVDEPTFRFHIMDLSSIKSILGVK
jgi:hypothetical protein